MGSMTFFLFSKGVMTEKKSLGITGVSSINFVTSHRTILQTKKNTVEDVIQSFNNSFNAL